MLSPRCLRVTCGRRDVATDGHGSMCTVMLGRHTTVHALEDFIPIYYVNTGELGARHSPPKPDGSKGGKIQGPLLGLLAEAGLLQKRCSSTSRV